MTTFDDASPARPAGRSRWERLGVNAGASIAGRIVAGLCQFALVPLLLGQLGTEAFGWTMALVAIVSLSQFADLGVAMALQHELSVAWARQDSAALRRTYASGQRLLWRLGLGWLLVTAPLIGWLGPLALAAPAGVGPVESSVCWLLVVLAACVGVPWSAGQRLAAALQLGWLQVAWTTFFGVALLAAAWAAIHWGVGRPGVLVTLLGLSQIAPGLVASWHLARRLGWREAPVSETGEMKRLWRAGRPFAAPNLAGALLQAFTPAAFSHFGGYETGATYAILQRLFGLAQQGHALLLAPLWPAYTEAATRGEHAWVQRSFRLSLALTALGAAGVALVTVLLPWIFPVWLGARAAVPLPGLAGLIALATTAAMLMQALSFLLLGLGRLQRVALAIAAVHTVTLGAAMALGTVFGGPGVAAALAAGTILGAVPVLGRESAAALGALARKDSTGPDRTANL